MSKNSSKKLDNYVYMSICEVTLEEFYKTSYSTFINFCDNNAVALNKGNINALSHFQKELVLIITNRLDTIYSFTPELTGEYIANFFYEKKYLVFEEAVRMIMECFPVSFN